jgi:hypothetical protein
MLAAFRASQPDAKVQQVDICMQPEAFSNLKRLVGCHAFDVMSHAERERAMQNFMLWLAPKGIMLHLMDANPCISQYYADASCDGQYLVAPLGNNFDSWRISSEKLKAMGHSNLLQQQEDDFIKLIGNKAMRDVFIASLVQSVGEPKEEDRISPIPLFEKSMLQAAAKATSDKYKFSMNFVVRHAYKIVKRTELPVWSKKDSRANVLEYNFARERGWQIPAASEGVDYQRGKPYVITVAKGETPEQAKLRAFSNLKIAFDDVVILTSVHLMIAQKVDVGRPR